ncbi:MAG: hypothetical protein JW821_06320 [Deltaproteobacteria bacterium]|nr:hypothetical protein [Deltaproteobacteria bacterium]
MVFLVFFFAAMDLDLLDAAMIIGLLLYLSPKNIFFDRA